MRIGVPAEIKNNEYRVGMTPSGAQDLTSDGHTVYIQSGACNGSGFSDEECAAAGARVVGTNAAKMAVGLGARVTILDNNLDRLRQLDDIFRGTVQTWASSGAHLAEACKRADLLIGGVLIPGASAPKLVTREMVRSMKKGSVIVDVAIDQGGCVETAHATTHSDPVYEVDGVIHYCVANMPG